MKYLLNDVTFSYHGDILKVCTKYGNAVELKDLSAKLFERLAKGDDDLACIDFLMQNGAKTRLEARRLLNSLLYTLSSLKMITFSHPTNYHGKRINIPSAMLEITNGCNFRCPHCYVDKASTKSLSLSKVKNIIDELEALGSSSILFTGGEVLTHKDFFKMYSYAYNKGFIISINSNGSLLNEQVLKRLIKRPPLAIEISVYGHDEATYQSFIKRKNQFDLVIKHIKELKNANINVVCKCVLTNSNLEFFDKIQQSCESLGVKFYADYLTFPQINGGFKQNDEQISPTEAIKFLKKNPHAEAHYLKLYSAGGKNSDSVFSCRFRDDTLFINCLSKVNICPCMQSISYPYKKGNLAGCVLKLKDLTQMKFRADAKCKDCPLFVLCRYCPAKFYLATGDYQNPPKWYCDFANLVYKNFIKGIRSRRVKYLREVDEKGLQNLGCKTDKNNSYILIYNDGVLCGYIETDENSKVVSQNIDAIDGKDLGKILKKYAVTL